MSEIENLRKKLLSRKKKAPIRETDLLSSGCDLINLAFSGHSSGAFAKGHYYRIVGDSDSGKTVMALTILAEATINKLFANYRIIYDNPERRGFLDIANMFPKLATRMEAPLYDKKGNPIYSTTIEEFYYHLNKAIKDGPCLYVLDSMDSLTSQSEEKKAIELAIALAKGKEAKGSYGDGKAKWNASNIRQVLDPLAKHGSILFVISQTHDAIGFGSMFEPKTASGGHALKFYAMAEAWLSPKGNLKRKDRQTGIIFRIYIKKNHMTGKKRHVDIHLYHSVGIDNVGSCIAFLTEEGHWKKDSEKSITAPEFHFKGSPEKLVHLIEKGNKEPQLREIVTTVWNEIEEACRVERKNRYE